MFLRESRERPRYSGGRRRAANAGFGLTHGRQLTKSDVCHVHLVFEVQDGPDEGELRVASDVEDVRTGDDFAQVGGAFVAVRRGDRRVGEFLLDLVLQASPEAAGHRHGGDTDDGKRRQAGNTGEDLRAAGLERDFHEIWLS